MLAFERANREYFATFIADRGDDYFAEFEARHLGLLDEQAAGLCYFHVLVDSGGAIVGRVNLVDVADRGAELGYRIAAAAGRQGLATAAVAQVCELATTEYGLRTLRAGTAVANVASQKVLMRNGFVLVDEFAQGDRPQRRFARDLSTPASV